MTRTCSASETCYREPSEGYLTCDKCRTRALRYYYKNKEARLAYNKRWRERPENRKYYHVLDPTPRSARCPRGPDGRFSSPNPRPAP